MTLTKTDRARVIQPPGAGALARRSAKSSTIRSGRGGARGTEPTAPKASRNTVPPSPGPRPARPAAPGWQCYRNHTRLSATDISALASMKNVAKCDTWCELQNPANHRVFERKLRPRPSAEGTPAWASRQNTLPPASSGRGTRHLAPRAQGRGGPKMGLPAYRAGHSTWWATRVVLGAVHPARSRRSGL